MTKGMNQKARDAVVERIAQQMLERTDQLLQHRAVEFGLPAGLAQRHAALLRALADSLGLTVFFLTHDLDMLISIADRVIALELGADDYLTKPFSMPELAARVKGVFRRAERTATARRPRARGWRPGPRGS
mgnify:CR=1 FL=1